MIAVLTSDACQRIGFSNGSTLCSLLCNRSATILTDQKVNSLPVFGTESCDTVQSGQTAGNLRPSEQTLLRGGQQKLYHISKRWDAYPRDNAKDESLGTVTSKQDFMISPIGQSAFVHHVAGRLVLVSRRNTMV